MMNKNFKSHAHGGALDLRSKEPRIVLSAIIATFVLFALLVLSTSGQGLTNSDDTMRLISLRDLVDGQNWFDLTQYRLGPEGVLMHWSRLVDAPIWVIYQLGYLLSGSQLIAEQIVHYLWPATTLFIAFLAVGYACKRLNKSQMLLPAMIIAGACFMAIGIYSPGALDHHNIQVALSLWLVALLMPMGATSKTYAAAGAVAVLMLAIGMETLPYVTFAGLFVAIAFLLAWIEPKLAEKFGLSFGLSSLIIMALTVSPNAYFNEYCDAYSLFHVGMCAVGGFGLALASLFARSLKKRFIGLAVVGLAALALLVLKFPQCLSNPLSSLDPILIEFWLERVIETRSLSDLLASDPFSIFGIFGMSLVGLVATYFIYKSAGQELRQTMVLIAGLLFIAIGVTVWQQRGMIFSASLAILPLAYVVSDLHTRYRQGEQSVDLLKMAGVGFLSLNVLWWIVGTNLSTVFSAAPTLQQQAGAVSADAFCQKKSAYEALSQEPTGLVLGSTNIGPNILKFTKHGALAGAYHRNIDGNLAAIQALLAAPNEAETIIRRSGATLIADCVADADPQMFKRSAPNGLQAALHNGQIPNYLELVKGTENEPLVLYRVKN